MAFRCRSLGAAEAPADVHSRSPMLVFVAGSLALTLLQQGNGYTEDMATANDSSSLVEA
jgi:hypothetical protein